MKTPLLLLLALATFCPALTPSEVSMDMTRDTADAIPDKNYTYSALADMTIRRHWDTDKGRTIDLDFDGRTDKLISVIITYDKPVPDKKAARDAKQIAHGSITWNSLSDESAQKYEMKNAKAAKCGTAYVLMECDYRGKCTRLSLYNALPDRNRALLEAVNVDVNQAAGAMGSNADMLANARILLSGEKKRKEKSAAAPAAATPKEPTEPEETEEEEETARPALMQEPAPRPKTETTEEPDLSTLNKPAVPAEPKERPKGPLDDITPLQWGIGGGALVLLFILWKLCTGRKDDAARLAARASAIRQNSGLTNSTLRARAGAPRRPRR